MSTQTSNNFGIVDTYDEVIHHKSSRRVTPAKGANYKGYSSGRKGRGIYPGAEYCPIDTTWAIAHAASIQAGMQAEAAFVEIDYDDRSDTWVTGLSIGMLEFMHKPAYALGRWNLGYRDCDLPLVS